MIKLCLLACLLASAACKTTQGEARLSSIAIYIIGIALGVASILLYIKQNHNIKFILFESFSVEGREK